MANPLPYYRILRDEHPLYYMPQWDTFALSRFEDIWEVLEVNDGTFVASEGTLPPTAVLAKHNDGPRRGSAVASLALSRGVRRRSVRRNPAVTFGAVAAEVGRRTGGQDPLHWPTSASTCCCRGDRST